jgi:hypothetical protein
MVALLSNRDWADLLLVHHSMSERDPSSVCDLSISKRTAVMTPYPAWSIVPPVLHGIIIGGDAHSHPVVPVDELDRLPQGVAPMFVGCSRGNPRFLSTSAGA